MQSIFCRPWSAPAPRSAALWTVRLAALFIILAAPLCAQRPDAKSADASSTTSLKLRGDNPTPAQFHGAIWVALPNNYLREKHRTEELARDLLAMPFDEIILQVADQGEAYYESDNLPKAFGIAAGYDPLKYFLQLIATDEHRPRRVFAWIKPLEAGNGKDGREPVKKHVRIAHPDWVNRTRSGEDTDLLGNYFLEPGLPDVRKHLAATAGEIVRRYRVAGLYVDGLHDPLGDREWGHQPQVFTEWLETNADADDLKSNPDWQRFRADQYDAALQAILAGVRATRNDALTAAGAFCLGPAPADQEAYYAGPAYRMGHQDWPAWLQNPDLDRIFVKDFYGETSEAEAFDGWMQFALAQPAKAEVAIGVAGYANESIDALAQVQRAAGSGAVGVALSHFDKPVTDVGAKDLFYNAVARSPLNGNRYVAKMQLPKTADLKPLKKITPIVAATEEPTPEPAATEAPETAPTPTPEPAPTAIPAETAIAAATATPDATPIATPPALLANDIAPVPDETGAATHAPAENGKNWSLIPAKGNAPGNNAATDATLAAAEQLAGIAQGDGDTSSTVASVDGQGPGAAMTEETNETNDADAAPAGSDLYEGVPAPMDGDLAGHRAASAAAQSDNAQVRQSVLADLLHDPIFGRTTTYRFIRPDEKALSFLRDRYPNIF